jgi:hypothetical protein
MGRTPHSSPAPIDSSTEKRSASCGCHLSHRRADREIGDQITLGAVTSLGFVVYSYLIQSSAFVLPHMATLLSAFAGESLPFRDRSEPDEWPTNEREFHTLMPLRGERCQIHPRNDGHRGTRSKSSSMLPAVRAKRR